MFNVKMSSIVAMAVMYMVKIWWIFVLLILRLIALQEFFLNAAHFVSEIDFCF